ncbi:ClpXP protease specificity-enhancing factor [Acidovorax sp. HDW3]|uniref:ClpXP protease specificity-enhancing factor n=1 Tax=Acidovorax sp. HDW3 TaxID=2714923 RepID=UPI00140A6767|nr:ClpXP protease specificity-enhancing factor [Acidovorax sp. HDW3]QIL44885.1 ClpXP protease specificity-enhancing factor [Acidovorax sp. HDW3]
MNEQDSPSTRPYLIRAMYEWCNDNGFTPYVVVRVDTSVQVPREYVKDGEIVLNVSMDATSALHLGNDYIEFKARFGGQPREIIVPISHVTAIYARENGQGMAFPPPTPQELVATPSAPLAIAGERDERVVPLHRAETSPEGDDEPPTPPATGTRPALKRVK